VIGGGGKMGRWFVEFLSSQGFTVEIADPGSAPSDVTRVDDWRKTDLKHDYIVLATPLGVTDAILRERIIDTVAHLDEVTVKKLTGLLAKVSSARMM